MTSRPTSVLKRLGIVLWKVYVNLLVALQLVTPASSSQSPRVFFAGAIPGSRGGPRVKVSRLKAHFQQYSYEFDLVYVLSNYPYLNEQSVRTCRKRSIPIVLNQNGVYFPGWYGPQFFKANSPNRIIYENCSYVFWQSQFAKQASRTFLSEIDPPGEVLYNAVDLDSFFPSARNYAKRRFSFLVAGKFIQDTLYQVEAAIRSLSLLKLGSSVEMSIAGLTDSQRAWAKTIADKTGVSDSVRYIASFRQSAAPSLLRSADAYLALKHMDTCPNLVIEALACGVPVIYSNSGGTPELVGLDAGIPLDVSSDWESKPKAPNNEDIADAMKRIIEFRENMGLMARFRAEEMFDIKTWFRRHQDIFQLVREVKP